MESEGFGVSCFKCKKSFSLVQDLIKHISLNHPSLTNYHCYQSRCSRSFNNIHSLRKHYSKLHGHNASPHSITHNRVPKENDNHISLESDSLNSAVDLDRTSKATKEPSPANHNEKNSITNELLCFISKLYTNPTLNRKVVQEIVKDCQGLLDNIFSVILNMIPKNENCFESIKGEFRSIIDVFENLGTEYKRFKYLKESESFISPESFYIGRQTILDNVSTPSIPEVKIKTDVGQKISIKLKLKMFLELPNVFTDILEHIKEESAANTSGVITSIIQGTIWKELETKFKGKVFFPLLLFYDDFEPCNPLGSRAVIYKVGAVYITLSCLPPEYASLLENIFLAQLSYTSDREFHGNKKVFSNLIDELKYLEEVGLKIKINNEEKQIYLPLILIMGDNLGLNSLLGFAESFNAHYFCRFCLTHRNITKVITNSSGCNLRTTENYDLHCVDSTYGIKEKCIWNDLNNFHVISNVYCDLMHDIFEGVLRYDMAFLINDLIKNKYFDLSQLNCRIKFFKHSKADLGIAPPLIKNEHLKNNYLVMSSSEMMSLVLYFGILVGDMVPESDSSWAFYLKTREMLNLLLSRSFTEERVSYLKTIIEEHHSIFCELYKTHLRPKHHIILHYPEVILRVGPLRNIWCMKFEAYHKLLKSTIKTTTCHKNVLLTMSTKDSLRFSERCLSKRGFSKRLDFHSLNINLENFNLDLNITSKLSENAFCVSWLNVKGIFFQCEFVIEISNENELIPEFGQIKYIVVDNENIYFLAIKLFTVGLLSHSYAYEILFFSKDQILQLYRLDQLSNPYPYNIHYMGDGKSVVPML